VEFVKENEYFETVTQLTGFYGTKTMEDYSKEQPRREREKNQRLKEANRLPNLAEGEEKNETVGEKDVVFENGEEGRLRGLRKLWKCFREFTREEHYHRIGWKFDG